MLSCAPTVWAATANATNNTLLLEFNILTDSEQQSADDRQHRNASAPSRPPKLVDTNLALGRRWEAAGMVNVRASRFPSPRCIPRAQGPVVWRRDRLCRTWR